MILQPNRNPAVRCSALLDGQPLTLLRGDCREVMKALPDASVNCCVTSPPYWGLRDYGTASWKGGDPACDHRGRSQTSEASTLGKWKDGGGQQYKERAGGMPFNDVCGKCGAERTDRQIGQEATPEEYVESLRELFAEVWRVLRDDGSAWLNLGDSYCSTAPGTMGAPLRQQGILAAVRDVTAKARIRMRPKTPLGMKPKDLCLIPARVALALRSDGWYLRSEIIWHKLAPMPESVKDRPTRAHEMLYLLTKSDRYYYNAAEARDALKESSVARLGQDVEAQEGSDRANGGAKTNGKMKAVAPACFGGSRKSASGNEWKQDPQAGANWRDVWSIGHEGYDGGHFAVMPSALAKRCITAGCPAGGLVLDPFAGSGTTGKVALELGRRAVLIELNPDYLKLSDERCCTTLGLPLAV